MHISQYETRAAISVNWQQGDKCRGLSQNAIPTLAGRREEGSTRQAMYVLRNTEARSQIIIAVEKQ